MKLLFLLAAIAPLNAQISVKPCGGTISVQKASVSPIIPVANKPVALHLEYSVPTLVTGGTSETAITYNFIPFSPTVESLCASVPCPLNPGSYKNDTSILWPSGLSGTVAITTKWFDPENTLLLCLRVGGKVGRSANVSTALTKRVCRNKPSCFRSPR